MTDNAENIRCLGSCAPPQEPKTTPRDKPHSVVIFGASGDLSRKKIYPTLWSLYHQHLLTPNVKIWGFARSKLNVSFVKDKSRPYAKISSKDEEKYENFWTFNDYFVGQYNSKEDFKRLNAEMLKFEQDNPANRIFYFAVPSVVYESIAANIKDYCMASQGWTRIILEKPFGKDLKSFEKLFANMNNLFTEEELYRVDHYLGKEMVQNLLIFRFSNNVFSPIWNRHHIACVKISFKEDFGVEGRGGYFDQYGMIRDVMQNHLMQILTLVAMEKPASSDANDIRNEKVKVLQAINLENINDVVLGQYVANPNIKDAKGYLDDPIVPEDSLTETYALAVFKINNDRWKDVPFIVSCGKGLDEKKVEVRIQFLNSAEGDIFEGQAKRNELVIRIQPKEAIYVKINLKTPGISWDMEESELDLTYVARYADVRLPDPYERLLLDIFTGSQANFVKYDELKESWRIFTPLLDKIEKEKLKPTPYLFGSRGPPEVADILKKNNFIYTGTYKWHKQN